ncbi:MAG: molybdenum cofactor guanylyltransferase [Methylococcaceae bacterium]|nr:molybdenum cofactor guanylyltransferase [Methylococcaceae bacterium]
MRYPTSVTGVILAGGLARRMHNQDKGLVNFNGQPLVSYAVKAMIPLAAHILINANRNHDAYQQFGWPVIADQTDQFDGPLAGILTAMSAAKTTILLVMPCDVPLITTAHLHRLLTVQEAKACDVAVAFDGERLHPVFLAIKTDLHDSLKAYLDSGQRRIAAWLAQQNMAIVDFSGDAEVFVNINTLPELVALESQCRSE